MTLNLTDASASAPTAMESAVRPDTAHANAMPMHPLSEDEALDWLRSQPGGRVTTSDAELGREWGWNRVRVGRRMRAWADRGLIKRKGGAVIVLGPVTNARTEGVAERVTAGVTECVAAGVTDRAVVPSTSRKVARPNT